MPYLEPERILREFSQYALAEVRPALADDEQFIRGQVGSMASTLRFLAAELEGGEAARTAQREALEAALDEASERVDDGDVRASLADARERIAGRDDVAEATLLGAADDALAAVDELPDASARAAREPLYDFLDARLQAQHRLLGRSDSG